MRETINERIVKPIRNFFCAIGKTKHYVLGDSHTEVFEYINFHNDFNVFFDVTLIGGATALGLRNPNSKTNALQIFKNKVKAIKNKESKLFFLLGEVDTGFVMWYRASKYNESIESQMSQTINVYFEFLDWVKSIGFNNITIVSSPMPTIKDNQDWGEVANLRKEVKATQIERTELTKRYNGLLRENAHKRKFSFINCDSLLLDPDTKIIKSVFLNKDPNNHHLDLEEYSKVMKSLIFKHD